MQLHHLRRQREYQFHRWSGQCPQALELIQESKLSRLLFLWKYLEVLWIFISVSLWGIHWGTTRQLSDSFRGYSIIHWILRWLSSSLFLFRKRWRWRYVMLHTSRHMFRWRVIFLLASCYRRGILWRYWTSFHRFLFWYVSLIWFFGILSWFFRIASTMHMLLSYHRCHIQQPSPPICLMDTSWNHWHALTQ